MEAVASESPELAGQPLARCAGALASRRPADDLDLAAARVAFGEWLGQAASVA